MRWEDKIREWQLLDVTKAFFEEIVKDLTDLQDALVKEAEPYQMMRLQGMCRALRGVLDMPKDGIRNPDEKENLYERQL